MWFHDSRRSTSGALSLGLCVFLGACSESASSTNEPRSGFIGSTGPVACQSDADCAADERCEFRREGEFFRGQCGRTAPDTDSGTSSKESGTTPLGEPPDAPSPSGDAGAVDGAGQPADAGAPGVALGCGGGGTVQDPWRICTVQDLELLRTRVTDAFVLMNDLDLAGVTFEYVPVFHGSIDGQGHAIRNWTYVDGGATFGLGFIGALDGGTLKHLRFTNAKLTSTSAARVGLLVGQAFDGARVHDVHVEGTVTASGPSGWAIGGLIGYVAGFEVTLCGSGTPHGVGVLVSSSSANTTLLTPDSTHSFITAGGLVGGSGNGQTLAVVSNSFAIGSMAGARAAWSGGIVGGYGGGYAGITIFRSYANVVAGPGLQGIAELVALFGAVTASFWELNAAGATESVAGGTGLSPAQMRTAAPFLSAGWSTAAWKFVPGSAPSIADHPPPPPRTVSCGGGLMAEYAALCPRNVDFSGVVDGTNCP